MGQVHIIKCGKWLRAKKKGWTCSGEGEGTSLLPWGRETLRTSQGRCCSQTLNMARLWQSRDEREGHSRNWEVPQQRHGGKSRDK